MFGHLIGLVFPENRNVLTGKKNLKFVANIIGKKTLRRQLGAGKTRNYSSISKNRLTL